MDQVDPHARQLFDKKFKISKVIDKVAMIHYGLSNGKQFAFSKPVSK